MQTALALAQTEMFILANNLDHFEALQMRNIAEKSGIGWDNKTGFILTDTQSHLVRQKISPDERRLAESTRLKSDIDWVIKKQMVKAKYELFANEFCSRFGLAPNPSWNDMEAFARLNILNPAVMPLYYRIVSSSTLNMNYLEHGETGLERGTYMHGGIQYRLGTFPWDSR